MREDVVVSWIQERSLRATLLLAGLLLVLGFVLPASVPASLGGWWSLLKQTQPLFWSLALFVVVAWGSVAVKRLAGERLFEATADIGNLSWEQFETYLAEYFRRRGAKVTYRGGTSADGGVDLVLDGPGGRRLLQAKHWRSRRVAVQTVRELWGVVQHERADGAVMVTSGTYTADAHRFAAGKNYDLIDGARLRTLVAELKGLPMQATQADVVSVKCPSCREGTLERRMARRGQRAGSYFLGCSRFPDCRYTQNL
jgi:restriction system protein